MNSPSLALAAGLLAYTGVSSAFVGYRLGPMVKSWARPSGRAFVLRTKLLRILAFGFNLSRKTSETVSDE